MRCVDVIRELAAPAGGPEVPGLAEHLARCPRCAAWAERDAQLGRLWDATRPPGPAPAEWDAVWARVSRALDDAPAPEALPLPAPPAPTPARPWARAAVVLLGVAQAAVLLFLVVAPGRPPVAPRAAQVVRIAPPVAAVSSDQAFELDAGELAVIVADREGVRVTSSVLNEGAAGVDFTLDGLNSLEAIAQQ